MVVTIIVLGVVAEAGAWTLVTRGGKNVWAVMSSTLAAMGLAVTLVRAPSLSPRVALAGSAAAGLGAGAALYLATRAFVSVASKPWPALRRDSLQTYARRGRLPLAAAVSLAAVANAGGEELFWRGLVQAQWSHGVGATSGAALAWLAFVAANLPSANLAIVAGAIVGGAVWGALAWWTHGVLASFACHGLWTALMLVLPVVRPIGEER